MLWNLSLSPPADESRRAIGLAACCWQPPAASPTVTALRIICGAWRESLAVSRQYEQLRSRGIPHDAALAEAFGIGPSPSHGTRETAKSIYFAGRA